MCLVAATTATAEKASLPQLISRKEELVNVKKDRRPSAGPVDPIVGGLGRWQERRHARCRAHRMPAHAEYGCGSPHQARRGCRPRCREVAVLGYQDQPSGDGGAQSQPAVRRDLCQIDGIAD
jgi:hypothetical protein